MAGLFLLCILISTVASLPIDNEDQSKIVKYDNKNDGRGNYEFSFETSNGIYRSETGKVVSGQSGDHLIVEGYFSFSDPDGLIRTVRYTADENGFHILPNYRGTDFSLPTAVVASLLG